MIISVNESEVLAAIREGTEVFPYDATTACAWVLAWHRVAQQT